MRDRLKHSLQVCVVVGLATVPMIPTAFIKSGGHGRAGSGRRSSVNSVAHRPLMRSILVHQTTK
jgi:hypothetical protein